MRGCPGSLSSARTSGPRIASTVPHLSGAWDCMRTVPQGQAELSGGSPSARGTRHIHGEQAVAKKELYFIGVRGSIGAHRSGHQAPEGRARAALGGLLQAAGEGAGRGRAHRPVQPCGAWLAPCLPAAVSAREALAVPQAGLLCSPVPPSQPRAWPGGASTRPGSGGQRGRG